MQKLELKHLAAYLPYQLKCVYKGDKNVSILGLSYNEGEKLLIKIGIHEWTNFFNIKPILRPLSDLTKEIEVNGEKFVPADILFPVCEFKSEYERIVAIKELELQNAITHSCTYFSIVQKLFEWHFDVFGLIEKGLAININTLDNDKKQN